MPFRSSVLITVLLGQPAFAVTAPTDFFTQISDWSGSSVMAGHGADVAVDGHLAVVGRPGDAHDGPQSGAVDVYMRTATEASLEGMPWQWTHVSTVRPEIPEAGARFGDAVAIDDGILVVGAWRYGDDHGSVWVVDLTDDVLPSSIRTDLMLEAPGIHPGDYLGCDVAIDDGLIVAGAWGADLDASEDDDVEVMTVGQAWTWTIAEIEGSFAPSTVLVSHAPQAGARFGTAVDIENGYVIVGAPRYSGSQGMVEVFEWYDGQWQFQQSLTSEMPHAWARYGAAVDLVHTSQGMALLVGSPGDNELGSQAGAAWLYDPIESGGSFMDGTKLTMGGGQSWDQAGSSVVGLDITVNGDEQASRGLILLGAPGWRDPNGLVQGAIMSFSGGDGESDLDWPEQQIVAFGDPHSAAGHSVAIGLAVVHEWDTDVISVWTGAPMSSDGQGRAFNLDVIASDRNGDCNEDFRFDLMEVLLLGAEVDCDGDGWHDACQVAYEGPLFDCDANGNLDSCEMATDPSLDCNADGELDVCQVNSQWYNYDCDGNGLIDTCEFDEDPTLDCNGDGVLDVCQAYDPALDCDENGLVDSCELGDDPTLDCNGDGVLDVCQAYDPAIDCDLNGLIDSCEIAVDPLLDCDADGLLDWCQILVDPLLDCDNDGVIDTCGFAHAVDLMSEYFVEDLDLGGLGGRWVPPVDASSAWGYCTISGTGAWIDPTNHTVLSMADDDSVEYPMPFSFPFAGQWWDNIRIGSNGYITFDTFDTNYIPSLSAHFSMMRISALFTDLDPSVSGDVRVGIGPANSVVVTWMDLPLWQQPTRLNRVQLVLHPNGAFETTWDLVDVDNAVVGVSVGLGVPPFFRETDLSDALNCDPQAATPFADCNENDVADQCELTIPGEPRWGVEHYSLDCDLINQQVRWVGQGASSYWTVCSTPALEFQIDPLGGTNLGLQDETSLLVDIGFSFPFAGNTFNEMYVSDNGYVTFGTAGGGYEALPVDHFMIPGIAAYRTDLDPSSGGQVLLGTGPGGSTAVTWLDVPMYSGAGASSSDSVSVQLVLHPDGAFEAIWLEVPVVTAIVGPSDGLGIPANFAQTDLSAAGDVCQSVHAWDDCDVSGVHDGIEIGLGCLTDLGGGVVQECGYFYLGDADGLMQSCICDITEDQQVDVMDLIAVLHAWGPLKIGSRFSRADVAPAKRDLHVGLPDLLAVIDSMGETCYQP